MPVRDGADTHVPAVECGTQTAQNVDRGACARSVRAAAVGKKCEEKLENAP